MVDQAEVLMTDAAVLHRALRVDELKRVLASGGSSSLMMADRADAGEDTASESLVEVGDGELGSESEFGHSVEKRKISRKPSKTDLAALLEGIGMDEPESEGLGRKTALGRPPY
jgi:hypothetical protein